MKIEGRIFRGLLDVLTLWSKTGQLVEGSNFCRLSPGTDQVLVELPTPSGWLALAVPADVTGMSEDWAVDLPLLMRVLKAASWPKKGPVGEVELALEPKALKVNVPAWRRGGKEWIESAPSHFSYPRAQGVCWDPKALPAVPTFTPSRSVLLEPAMVGLAIDGASHCSAGSGDRGVLRCVELICRADELVGLATDGGVVGLASEPAGLALEDQLSAPVPIAPIRSALAIWKKAGLGDAMTFVLGEHQGQPLLTLAPPTSSAFRFVLKLEQGHLPLDALQQLPSTTTVSMGRTKDRGTLLTQLELAELNPGAKVVWLVWENGGLSIRSHGLLLDQCHAITLVDAPGPACTELAIETGRIRSALDQLKASGGGDGPISLAIDSLERPTRLMLTQVNAATEQVRRVVVLATAGTSYAAFRSRAEEAVAQATKASAKERRRQRFHAVEPDDHDAD